MSILFFDTETTGFYEPRLDLNDPRQQHLVQLAAILTDDEATTDICKLPKTGNGAKYGGYKWPKLQEAYRHFFGKDFDGAHDAMADVLACRDVYFAIKKLEAEHV